MRFRIKPACRQRQVRNDDKGYVVLLLFSYKWKIKGVFSVLKVPRSP